jgi:hypothetical protein
MGHICDREVRELLIAKAENLYWCAQRAVASEKTLLERALKPVEDALGTPSPVVPPPVPSLPEQSPGMAAGAASHLEEGVIELMERPPFLGSRAELRLAIRCLGDSRAVLLEGLGLPDTLYHPYFVHPPIPKQIRHWLWRKSKHLYSQFATATEHIAVLFGVAALAFVGWLFRVEIETFMRSARAPLTSIRQ